MGRNGLTEVHTFREVVEATEVAEPVMEVAGVATEVVGEGMEVVGVGMARLEVEGMVFQEEHKGVVMGLVGFKIAMSPQDIWSGSVQHLPLPILPD